MIRKWHIYFFLTVLLIGFILHSCTKDKGKVDNGYPENISNILVKNCATVGCHTNSGKAGSAGLSLETWEQLFQGSRNGAVCIPYNHEVSTLFLFTNIYPSLGPVNLPTMPINKSPLSLEEIKILSDWIDKGAPSSSGKIAFSNTKNKIYVTNQGCDLVTVFDGKTQLQMRTINVGVSPQIESPHMIKVSPDGMYWYVVFSNGGTILEKHNTSDDTYAGQANLGIGSWNTMTISNDSKFGFAIDWNSNGRIAYLNLSTMNLLGGSPWNGFADAHGSALDKNGDTLYVTASVGNYLHVIPVNDPSSFSSMSLNPPAQESSTPLFDPHEIAFSPDSLSFYVTCPKSNEVRVMRISDKSLIATIPTGAYPLEMSFSKTTPYLFVSCEYDSSGTNTNRGSVTVIDYTTNKAVKNLRLNMAEPHGIAVDDANGLVYVANRNSSGKILPHHVTSCKGNNGFISFIDLKTREVIADKRIEVGVDPYSIAVRP